MKFFLETHSYAPELNRIHFAKGGSMPAPGCTSIKEAKQKYFAQHTAIRLAKVEFKYKTLEGFDRIYQGTVDSYQQILDFARQMKSRHNLADVVSVRSALV